MPRPFKRLPFSKLPERPLRPHRFFELEQREVRVQSSDFGDTTVAYRQGGEGPPLLLLHGLMTSSYSFRYLTGLLEDRFTLYIPDLLGHGDTDKPVDRSYRAPRIARWLGALLRALGIWGCPAVSNSLGGYLSMWLALQEAGAFSKLVNLHSPGAPELRLRALEQALKVPGAKRLLARAARVAPERWVHRNVHYYDETLKSLEEARVYGAPLASAQGAQAFARIMAEVLSVPDLEDFNRRLVERRGEGFPCPLLMIYAREDPMVPPRVGDHLKAQIPDAELIWLERSSHFMHVDSPERVAPLLLEFLG